MASKAQGAGVKGPAHFNVDRSVSLPCTPSEGTQRLAPSPSKCPIDEAGSWPARRRSPGSGPSRAPVSVPSPPSCPANSPPRTRVAIKGRSKTPSYSGRRGGDARPCCPWARGRLCPCGVRPRSLLTSTPPWAPGGRLRPGQHSTQGRRRSSPCERRKTRKRSECMAKASVGARLRPPQILAPPRTPECDGVWRRDLCQGGQVKMRPLEWASPGGTRVLTKRGN